MCDVPRMAVFCKESIACCPGIVLRYFCKLLLTIIIIIIIIIMSTKGVIAFWPHIHSQDQHSIPFPFSHREKLALFRNFNFIEVYINFDKYVIH
jgi:hypothetical protein